MNFCRTRHGENERKKASPRTWRTKASWRWARRAGSLLCTTWPRRRFAVSFRVVTTAPWPHWPGQPSWVCSLLPRISTLSSGICRTARWFRDGRLAKAKLPRWPCCQTAKQFWQRTEWSSGGTWRVASSSRLLRDTPTKLLGSVRLRSTKFLTSSAAQPMTLILVSGRWIKYV